jgi:tetratricopeptide (TPR) repeat protein
MSQRKKICYAIMPYGSASQELQDHFELVFQLLIKNPAEAQGYQVIREDHLGQPGDITRNIMRHLAEGALVVADLSGQNWNVAYELGVRHALVKGGTILICDNETNMPFDVSNLKVIVYNRQSPVSRLKSVQEEMTLAIQHRESEPMDPDNSIHDIYPFEDFTVSYLEHGDSDQQAKLLAMTEQLEKVKQENTRLRARLAQGGLAEEEGEQVLDIGASIEQALQSMEYSGTRLTYTLREALAEENPDYQRIGSVLKAGLTEGYLTEANFRSLYVMFKRKNLPQLTGLILEVASQRFPTSLDFKSYLSELYSDSYQTRDKALRYANEVLQVSVEDGVYTTTCRKIDADQLIACLNAYIGLNRYDIIIQVAPQLMEVVPKHREVLMRNLAVAYRQTGEYTLQFEILTKLLHEYPANDINHYRVCQYYDSKGDNVQAYYQLEMASILDPTDLDYLFGLAGYIVDYRLTRCASGVRTKLTRAEALSAMVPFLMRAIQLETSQENYERCKDFLNRNQGKNYIAPLYHWIKDGMPEHGIEGLDYGPVDYIVAQSENVDDALCSKIEF